MSKKQPKSARTHPTVVGCTRCGRTTVTTMMAQTTERNGMAFGPPHAFSRHHKIFWLKTNWLNGSDQSVTQWMAD